MNACNIKLISAEDNIVPKIGFEGVIGQKVAIDKINFFLQSHDFKTPFPTLLLTGSHGLGKTLVAKKLAENMHRKFVEINSSSIETYKDFIDKVLMETVYSDNKPTTIFIDEAHNLSNDVTTILLTLLSSNKTGINLFPYKNFNVEYDMAKINVIFATTDAHKIFSPLLNRTEMIYFKSYNHEDLINMLKYHLKGIEIACDKEDLADACRGRGRDAVRLATNIIRYCKVNNINYIDNKGWEYIKNLFEIFPKGLNKQEVDLLNIVKEFGPISAFNIAMRLMVNEDNIENEMEIRVRELGYIANTSKGRYLTKEGEEYLAKR